MSNRKPVLNIIAGPNGSGKTTYTRLLLENEWSENCIFINPDNIAQERFGDWNSKEASLKAAQVAEAIRMECLEKGIGMVVETVLSREDKIEFIQLAKSKGFFVRLYFIGTSSPIINIKRVARRVQSGGHNVPTDKIVERYYRSLALYVAAARIADKTYLYDNSRDDQTPQILFRTEYGKVKKKYAHLKNYEWAKTLVAEFDVLASEYPIQEG